MKKIIKLISSIGLCAPIASSVVSCNGDVENNEETTPTFTVNLFSKEDNTTPEYTLSIKMEDVKSLKICGDYWSSSFECGIKIDFNETDNTLLQKGINSTYLKSYLYTLFYIPDYNNQYDTYRKIAKDRYDLWNNFSSDTVENFYIIDSPKHSDGNDWWESWS